MRTSRWLSALMLAAALPVSAQQAPVADTVTPWRSQGQLHLQAVDHTRERRRARNVILFVGDGMGIATLTAARIRAGQLAGGSGEEYRMPWERFPWSALVKTYNTDAQTPDSAGTMSALMTGVKTRSGVLSVDASVPRGDCAASLRGVVPTLLERAEDHGRATGVISTARLTHATPAATYAHAPNRDWEAATADPACRDIATQLVEFDHGDGIEVLLGGGRQMFLPREVADPEDAGQTGARGDGRNLIDEWQARHPDGRYVWNLEQFRALQAAPAPHVLGLFERSHMEFEHDRPSDAGGEPSLAEMTAAAIEMLSRNRKGYFLVVEGGRVDHANHAGNAFRALSDTIALAAAVEAATKATRERDTLIIVTADHAHTMTLAGYARRGAPILGLAGAGGSIYPIPMVDAGGLPYTIIGYANGPGHVPGGRPDLSHVDTTAPDYRQEATVPMRAETHSGIDVAAFARGPSAHYVRGVMEQSTLYYVMQRALGLEGN